jgi:hypothetical protein
MRCIPFLCAIAVTLPLAAACRSQTATTPPALTDRTNAPASTTTAGRVSNDAANDAANGAPMPHGDHNPHYGGVVYMHGEMHFEVVLDRGGRHRVYFSDAVRADLPASVASSVTLTITRPGWSPEAITAAIDEQGEGWRADGAPVGPGDATARVAFVVKNGISDGATNSVTNDAASSDATASGESYWIDVPFMPPAKPTAPSP